MGAYLDFIPTIKPGKFQGTMDCFLFQLHPKVSKWQAKEPPPMESGRPGFLQLALFENDYLCIGFGGKGPAIRADDQLRKGRTYESETFLNEPLVPSNDFEIANVELIKL